VFDCFYDNLTLHDRASKQSEVDRLANGLKAPSTQWGKGGGRDGTHCASSAKEHCRGEGEKKNIRADEERKRSWLRYIFFHTSPPLSMPRVLTKTRVGVSPQAPAHASLEEAMANRQRRKREKGRCHTQVRRLSFLLPILLHSYC
jgi:hypothetical protein